MSDLLHTALGFPTVVLTTLVGISLLYWLMVILGALDIDIIGDAHADGVGDLHVGDAHVGDAHVGDAHGDVGGHGGASFLSVTGFNRVPLTISMSVWWLSSWLVCLAGNRLLEPAIGSAMPGWVLASIILIAALIVTIPVTSALVRPLAPVFVIHEAKSKKEYVGQVCTVKTGRVDADFGHADIMDGGDHLIVEVRCDKGDRFERGDKALIIEFDEARDAYVIEPMDELLAHKDDQGSGS